MEKPTFTPLLSFLTFMVAAGLTVAVIGIYVVGDSKQDAAQFETYHDFDRSEISAEESRTTLYGTTHAFLMQGQADQPRAASQAAEQGITVGELMRLAGIFAVVAALFILILIEFVYRDRINRMNYRLLLIISLFVLPVIVGLGTSATVLETTKTVQSCGTCHVMDPFVNDLYDPGSTTLAARHYKNQWISEYQCYTCHTTYGAHGTFEGKRDGFRHWLLFVTRTWDEPISYSGSYPNMNCTACHGGTTAYLDVPSHLALADKFRTDEVSCTSCHGPAHPTPQERDDVPEYTPADRQTASQISETDIKKLEKLVEALNE